MFRNFRLLTTICALALTACSPTLTPPEPTQSEPPTAPIPDDVDENGFLRGEAYISESQLFIMESFPVQVAVSIKGDLPTPCHQLITKVAEPDAQNQIFIEVYAGYKLGDDCIQVLEPFEENVSIPMEGQPDGIYTIWINGELVGEFSYPA